MNTLGKISWLVSLLAISSVTACGSDDDGGGDGGGASLDSGVDEDKPVEDLTDDEAEAICEAGADYFVEKFSSSSLQTAFCRAIAVGTALGLATDEESMQDMCNSLYESCTNCIDDPDAEECEDMTEVPIEEPECGDEEVPSDCSSSVGELEACLKAEVDQGVAAFNDIPDCDEIGPDTEPPTFEEDPPLPAACETVEENCPEALE